MQHIIIRKPGGYDALKIETAPSPKVGHLDVLVAVAYAGVNYADCLIRIGIYQSARELSKYPLVPGFDFSGTVVQVGSQATTFKVGDKVFGTSLFGSYQTEIALHEDRLFKVPKSISLKEAASLPTTFLVAHYLLNSIAHTRQGEKILVRSIAGGVGSWLGTLSKHMGMDVYGTVSTEEKRQTLTHLGYTRIYTNNERIDESFDVIANAYGRRTILEDFNRLLRRGRLVLYGFHGMVNTNKHGRLSPFSWIRLVWNYLMTPHISPFRLVNQNKSVTGFNLSYLAADIAQYRAMMTDLISLLNEHCPIPPIQEIPFTEVATAHRLLESGKVIGKIVLKMPIQ